MSWKDFRLQFDVPPGWRRRDDEAHLTFQAPSGLTFRVTPLHVPAADAPTGARSLLDWALARSQSRLGAGLDSPVTPCRFGLCATFSGARGAAGRPRFWLLAGPLHVLLVSAQGGVDETDRIQAQACVASMHLVAASAFPS